MIPPMKCLRFNVIFSSLVAVAAAAFFLPGTKGKTLEGIPGVAFSNSLPILVRMA
jgi:hypothetical protein